MHFDSNLPGSPLDFVSVLVLIELVLRVLLLEGPLLLDEEVLLLLAIDELLLPVEAPLSDAELVAELLEELTEELLVMVELLPVAKTVENVLELGVDFGTTTVTTHGSDGRMPLDVPTAVVCEALSSV